MYECAVNSSSTAPHQKVIFSGKCFFAYSSPSLLEMIDTQEQAIEFVNKVQIAAQHAKSIVSEIAAESPELMESVSELHPGLFPREGRLDIVDVTMRLQAKDEPINRGDIMNLMIIGNRIGLAFLIELVFYEVYWPENPMEWFIQSKLPIM